MIISALIDSREPPEIQKLDFGVPTIVTALDAGDMIIACKDGHTLIIERKEPSDLLGSIRNGRLFNQCAKMRELSQFCYLVITGKLYWTHDNKVQIGPRITSWNWDSVQGALLTVQEMGISIVYADDFKNAVERLARRSRNGIVIKPTRKSEPMQLDEIFLSSLPSIGPILAQRILGNGPACYALEWLTNIWSDGLKVPGIGQNQKIEIREILGLKSNEYLTIAIKEKINEE